jgi:hypothetical protein
MAKRSGEPPVPYILTEAGRYADLMKQGFMKPLPTPRVRKDGKRFGTPKPLVSCDGCQNWHRSGQHTVTDAAQRRANVTARRAAEKRSQMCRDAALSGDWTAFDKAYPDNTVSPNRHKAQHLRGTP